MLDSSEVLVLAPTRGAADDFVRACGRDPGSLFGVHRLTPIQLAADLATGHLARSNLAPISRLGIEALAARTVYVCRKDAELGYFGSVTDTPGFARALASTLSELRMEGVTPGQLAVTGTPGKDLARLLACYEKELAARSLADLAAIFGFATEAAAQSPHRLLGLPMLLLDISLGSAAERAFVAAVTQSSPSLAATALAEDFESVTTLERILGAKAEILDEDPAAVAALYERRPCGPAPAGRLRPSLQETSLEQLRRHLFSLEAAPRRELDGSVDFFSAGSEGLECVEIARRIRSAAEAGTTFDQMAILLRDPDAYLPLVEDALRRAGIPGYFTAGTIRPDPSGRAFLALLDCAAEGLSASKFAEYLSLGQVPVVDESGSPPAPKGTWVAPEDKLQFSFKFPPPERDVAAGSTGISPASTTVAAGAGKTPALPRLETDQSPVIEGTLRTPFGWEKLLIDAAVIGGKDRWSRRLRGLKAEYNLQLQELEGEDDSRRQYLEKQLERLNHLQRFALPVIEFLDSLPRSASWGDWSQALRDLAEMALRQPESVLSLLNELQPMDAVGPVGLHEVRQVLTERLSFLRREPPTRRYGQVFVGALDEVNARCFAMVFLPGLAEGIFPRKISEDPLLLDEYRQSLSSALANRDKRTQRERLLLRNAAAAARSRLCVSYPRTDIVQGRARIPSFYALEVLRAAEGRFPALGEIARRATEAAQSRLGWPAPKDSRDAIDDAEHDLAVLEPLLHRPPEEVKGYGTYLMDVNPCLARSLRARWQRWDKRWSEADGIFKPDAATSGVLAAHRMNARSYSPSALQHYAACPYRFLLQAIHRLRQREEAVAIEQLDPLTRGALFHEAQFRFFRALQGAKLLPITEQSLDRVMDVADKVFNEVVAEYEENLAPAIPQIWTSEIEDLRTDLRGWVRQLAVVHAEWMPIHFEYAFGLEFGPQRDPGSSPDPAVILDGVQLRGSIDLLEQHQVSGVLRVTDHKTGRAPQPPPRCVGKGETLQPLLYALAAEKLLGKPVKSSILSYCTQRGNYSQMEIPLNGEGRLRIAQAMKAIDGAIQEGSLPAAPRKDACAYCDYRMVCGPHEERRVKVKKDRLDALEDLRCLP